MPCYYPIRGYRSRRLSENGKRPIVFNLAQGLRDMPVDVPCGKCRGCRLEYSRQWAIRCIHESQMHTENSFITLTYAPYYLPGDRSVSKREFQLFMKRLRKAADTHLQYFACGEYGEKNNRPHYHAIIFGYDFPDKKLWSQTKSGDFLYRSDLLEKVWPYGHSLIGSVTFESAAYVARYVMKKRKGPDQEEHYKLLDKKTGEIHQLEPEFCLMSRGNRLTPDNAIGKKWMLKYKGDTNKDYVTRNGNKFKLPRYYDNIIQTEDEIAFMERKINRMKEAEKRKDDNTLERLRVREIIKVKQTDLLKRGYEND